MSDRPFDLSDTARKPPEVAVKEELETVGDQPDVGPVVPQDNSQ